MTETNHEIPRLTSRSTQRKDSIDRGSKKSVNQSTSTINPSSIVIPKHEPSAIGNASCHLWIASRNLEKPRIPNYYKGSPSSVNSRGTSRINKKYEQVDSSKHMHELQESHCGVSRSLHETWRTLPTRKLTAFQSNLFRRGPVGHDGSWGAKSEVIGRLV